MGVESRFRSVFSVDLTMSDVNVRELRIGVDA